MRKKSMTLLLIGSLILSLAGCGRTESEVPKTSEQVELIEPVNAQVAYEVAARRNMYDAAVYPASVIPYIEEYSASSGFAFGAYGAFLGETVKKGRVLLSSDTTKVDEQIKAKKEEIADMEKAYAEYVEKQTKELEHLRSNEPELKRILDEAKEPEEFLPPETEGGDPVPNPYYPVWKSQIESVEGDYRITKHSADIIETELKQRKELYELDHQHQEYLLKTLQKNRSTATVSSKLDGTVVAVASFGSGDYVVPDRPVAAVADMSQKFLKCEYINNTTIKKAKDVYALIDGRRVEVEHVPLSADEYNSASANGGKAYSTFKLPADADNVKVGDYAVIVVMSNLRENVISISKSAVHKDESGNFVYVLRGNESVRQAVQIGFADGVYMEILSGLEEGDRVLNSSVTAWGTQTVKIGRGDYSSNFSDRAELTYSSSSWQKNSIKNGTVYFVEGYFDQFQHVDKGQVVAKVRVEPDSLALTRNETRLTRLKERLADFQESNKGKEKEEYYINTLKGYQEQIGEIEKSIAEQRADFATKEIRAEKSGVLIRMADFQKESIIGRDANLWEIADESSCYMLVADPNQLLQYGNGVQITYTDEQQQEKTVECMVGSMSRLGVSSALRGDDAMIVLPPESVEDILMGMFSGEFWVRRRYKVEAKIRVMKDVLLVPRNAVNDVGGKTYVYVKDENGGVKAQGFVAGGFNESYYYVVQGLSEGMEVCLK